MTPTSEEAFEFNKRREKTAIPPAGRSEEQHAKQSMLPSDRPTRFAQETTQSTTYYNNSHASPIEIYIFIIAVACTSPTTTLQPCKEVVRECSRLHAHTHKHTHKQLLKSKQHYNLHKIHKQNKPNTNLGLCRPSILMHDKLRLKL